MSKLADFLSELKRRRVYRVAAVYACVAFIIFQIVDATFEPLNLPDWASTFVVVLLVIGFPIAVGMAWAFDLTEEGLVKTKSKREATATKAPHPIVGNKTLAIIAVLAVAFGVWTLVRSPSPGDAPIRSIAVLPLEDMIGDPEQEYFTEGMHEAIISNLNRLGALKVISRTSTMRYEDTDKLLPEIAQELGVDALVEGSVFMTGNQVRVTAQLIHGASDEHLWSNEYEGVLEEILSLQRTIAQAIANEIGLALTPEEETYLASAPQVNPEAYQLYLWGWQQRLLENSESIPRAVEYLEQAVELDPDFAPAWSALAVCYGQATAYTNWPNDSAIALQYEALDKALDLDPDDVTALTWQGVLQTVIDYNFANTSFRRALELEPGNVNARYEYGHFLFRWGQPGAALAEFRLAQDRDPVNPLIPNGFRWVYNYTRQPAKGLEYTRLRDELRNVTVTGYPGPERQILMEQGRYEEVAALADEAGATWLQLRAEWALGNREKVYAIRDSMVFIGEWPQQEQEDPWWYARFYGLVGEKEQALGLLETVPEAVGWTPKMLRLVALVYSPEFDSLRAEPRFKAMLQEIGLQEVFDENGNFIQPLDETLEAYNAPGSR